MQENMQEQTRKLMGGFPFPGFPTDKTAEKAGEKK
jgi:hypothetical protein